MTCYMHRLGVVALAARLSQLLFIAGSLAASSASGASLVLEDDFHGFSILDNVENSGGPPSSGSFSESFSIARFDSNLGTLQHVAVDWILFGEVDVGVSARGPLFPGGGGTVSGSSTLSFSLDLPTSALVAGSDSVAGVHTGSIAGPPGVGASDVLSLPFSEMGGAVFTSPGDLALFTGSGAFDVDVLLTMENVQAVIADPGPRFLMRVGVPQAGMDFKVTYEYLPIPEPAAFLLAATAWGAIGAGRRRSREYAGD